MSANIFEFFFFLLHMLHISCFSNTLAWDLDLTSKLVHFSYT